MLQIFSRAERKSNRVLNIGFVTQDGEISRQFREHVAQFGGIKVSLVASERVTAGFNGRGLSVFVYDLDTASETTLQEFERFMNQRPQHLPVIVLSPAVDDQLVRWFLRLRVADWVKTPLSPGELVTTCARVLAQSSSSKQEVKCLTFTGARGGVGTTSIAIHAGLLAAKRAGPAAAAACIVDLDLLSGACADYLDLQPAWALDEIIANPSRLDIHMLDVMMATHAQGVKVLSARRKYGEVSGFAPEVITRTLDLASQKYPNLVVDLPRHAESWTDGVILGSSAVYIVTDFSVPGVKAAHRMAQDIASQYAGEVDPKVIINKYSRALFGSGLSAGDVKGLLGGRLAGYVSAEDSLLKEAIDRGVPVTDIKARNAFVADIAKILGY